MKAELNEIILGGGLRPRGSGFRGLRFRFGGFGTRSDPFLAVLIQRILEV